MVDVFIFVLIGVVVIAAIGVGLYLRNKTPEEKKKFTHWLTSWGLTLVGIVLTLIQITIYYLDNTQFEFTQLIIGISLIIFGSFYIYKYRKQS